MRDIWDSLVRTVTPLIVGAIIGGFAAAGIAVDPALEPSLVLGITGLATTLYYAIARLLETKLSPKFGWLLGLPKAPTYEGVTK